MHMVVVGQEIALGWYALSIITSAPHEVPFHSTDAPPPLPTVATAIHMVVVGHDIAIIGRVYPLTYDGDPHLDTLVAVTVGAATVADARVVV